MSSILDFLSAVLTGSTCLGILGITVWMLKRIVNKAGYSGWWLLTLAVPVLFYAMIWVFALRRWPAMIHRQEAR